MKALTNRTTGAKEGELCAPHIQRVEGDDPRNTS